MLITGLLIVAAIGALGAHATLLWQHRVRELLIIIALDLVLVLLVWAGLDDNLWTTWMREDAWVEWSTVYAMLAACGVFLWRARDSGGLVRLTCAGLALFCFFVAGEEMSWGQRIFTFEPPEIFLENNFQQEANLHNLLNDQEIAGYSLDSRFLIALICMVYGVLASAIGGVLGRVLPDKRWATSIAPSPLLIPAFALIAAVELDYPLHLVGEAAEWCLGLTFLADALLRSKGAVWDASRWQGLEAKTLVFIPITILLGVMTAPILETVVYGSDVERVAEAQAEITQLTADLQGAMESKIDRKSRVHKRVYTAVTNGYLAFEGDSSFLEGQRGPAEATDDEPGRNDRKGYFLDPWKNPYWILYDDHGDSVVVYSFGPNRRRDIQTKPYKEVMGDDLVGVVR